MTGQIVYAGYAIPDGAAVRDFAVYIEADHIVVTGTRAELTRQYPDVPVFGGDDLIMLPGFVNAHDHGRSIGTQSLGVQDSYLEIWLSNLGRLPALPSYLAAAWEGLQLVKSGVTSTAHSHNPSSWETQFEEIPPTLRGYADAGVRVAMHPVIIDQNPLVYADADKFIASLPEHLREEATRRNQPPPLTADAYFAGLDALYKQYHDTETHRVHIQASPAGGQWCSDELIRRAVKWAKGHNTRVQMHMLETPYQRIYAFRKWGKSFVRHLNDIYALGNWLTLAHMVWMEDDDANLLAEAGVGIAHNPSSNLRLRSGIAPVAKMMIAHARLVGIGMDGHTLDEDHDFLREMRLAWTLANRPGMTNAGVTAGEILFAGTINAANITFGSRTPLGFLQPGYLADLVLLDWNAIRGPWAPDDYPAVAGRGEGTSLPEQEQFTSIFLRRAKRDHVRHVMSGGEWLLRDGVHTRLNEVELAGQLKEALSSQMPNNTPYSELGHYIRAFYEKWDSPPQMWR